MATQLEEFVKQTIDALLKELPPEKRLEGLSTEERLEGLSPDERFEGLSPAELQQALDALQRRLGTSGSSPSK